MSIDRKPGHVVPGFCFRVVPGYSRYGKCSAGTVRTIGSRLAYNACQQHQPDLVLIDYTMPHLNGLAVMEQLRQLPAPCRLVIISMYAEKVEIARLEAIGMHGYFAKTTPADRLVELLERVCCLVWGRCC